MVALFLLPFGSFAPNTSVLCSTSNTIFLPFYSLLGVSASLTTIIGISRYGAIFLLPFGSFLHPKFRITHSPI
jgi:hypothetical protein